MATNAKMGYNFHQNNRHGAMPMGAKDMEVSQDMHLKMSKKIAQLTKVIYALNTKNDEHESIVAAIESRHANQVGQVLEESRLRVSQLESRASGALVAAQRGCERVVELERRASEQRAQQAEWLVYRERARETESTHAARLAMLTLALDDGRRRLAGHDDTVRRLRDDYAAAMVASHGDHQGALAAVERGHAAEVDALKRRVDVAENGLRAALAEHEENIAKVHAFGEHERALANYETDADAACRLADAVARADRLSGELTAARQQAELRVAGLVEQLSVSDERAESDRRRLALGVERAESEARRGEALKEGLRTQEAATAAAEKQLAAAKETNSQRQLRLMEMDKDVIRLRETCDRQKSELLTKSTNLGELQATKLDNEAKLRELELLTTRLRSEVAVLEAERRATEGVARSETEGQRARTRALQRSLDDLAAEKADLEKSHADEVRLLRSTQEGAVQRLSSDHAAALSAQREESEANLGRQQTQAANQLAALRERLESELRRETDRLTAELATAGRTHEETQTGLSTRLRDALLQVESLKKLSDDSAVGLGSATSQVNSLEDCIARLKVKLEETEEQLKSAKIKMAALQAEYDKSLLLHDGRMKEAKVQLKTRLGQLTKDRDEHWTQKLQEKMSELRAELAANGERERREALEGLEERKNEEMGATRLGWERKVKGLLEEVVGVRAELERHLVSSEQQLAVAEAELSAQRDELLRRLSEEAEQTRTEAERRRRGWEAELARGVAEREAAVKGLEATLTLEHREALAAEVVGHRSALEAARSAAERELEQRVALEAEQHRVDVDRVQTEARHRQAIELDQVVTANEEQLMAARLQLDRALEVGRQQEAEHAMQSEELQEELRRASERLAETDAELLRRHQAVGDLSRDLKAKGREVVQMRKDAQSAARAQTEAMMACHASELRDLNAKTSADIGDMLTEFSEAQRLLTEKISHLKGMLEEAEDRYQNRESRSEDVDSIARLQAALLGTQNEIAKLIEEKRYYQRELVNRETNFNKVFGSCPQVGLINPLNFKRGRAEKKIATTKANSTSSVLNRLVPIPGSPVHDGMLNHVRPLPPSMKKSIK